MPDNGPPKNLLSLALKDDLFGIYIHWPFCASKCPYCDFNSHVRDTIDVDQWQKALLQDLAACHQDTSFKKVTSIFFGGGTPSTMPPQIVSALIQKIHDLWTVDVTIEITLEANPTSIEQSKFKDLSQAGINRVSLGIQSLDDQALKFLGRTHNAQEAFKAIEVAQNTFPKHNFDFIYTLPGQSLSSWKRQLKEAIQLGSSHLSLYQLTIEEGTPFYLRHAKGDFTMPTEDESASFFETTRTHMHESGFFAYEVSNFARSPETQCQHNLTYWQAEDYIGIGPGAHGRFTKDEKRHFTRRHRWPEKWMETVFEKGTGTHQSYNLSDKDKIEECLMMGLRLSGGINHGRFHQKTGFSFNELFDKDTLNQLKNEELLTVSADTLKLSSRGIQMLDSVLSFLFKRMKIDKDLSFDKSS